MSQEFGKLVIGPCKQADPKARAASDISIINCKPFPMDFPEHAIRLTYPYINMLKVIDPKSFTVSCISSNVF